MRKKRISVREVFEHALLTSSWPVFQQIDCDYAVVDTPYPNMPGSQVGPLAMIRIYGVTDEGYSVLCNVHGFTPYFYAQVPQSFEPSQCAPFMKALEEQMVRSERRQTSRYIQHVELVQKQSIMGFSGLSCSMCARC
jgi:DNA polymerase delta subunit 1